MTDSTALPRTTQAENNRPHQVEAEEFPPETASATASGQVESIPLVPMIPRPHQVKAAAGLNKAIWASLDSRALHVDPVATGKSLILIIVAWLALCRGCRRVIIVSRAEHIAAHCLNTLEGYALHLGVTISGGFYTGRKKESASVLFATVQTLARHLDVVEGADLVLIDECDQAFVRATTKEYAAVLSAAQKYAGVTGTPFVLEKGRTNPIFDSGRMGA